MSKILVVEDSKFQSKMAVEGLEKVGFEVGVAYDGAECIEKVKQSQPDLIVLDIEMPRMDGYETCKRLKADKETAAIPVMFLTKKDEVMDIICGLEAGGDNFITKPYEMDYLLKRIQVVLENQKLLKQGKGLTQEKVVKEFTEEIVLTKNREQIFEVLFKTLSKNIEVEIIGLILLKESHYIYLVTAYSNLSGEVTDDFTQKMLAALSRLHAAASSAEELKPKAIVISPSIREAEGDFVSFINVPLLDSGKIIGMLSAANSMEKGFIEDDVKQLYQIGTQSVRALAKITRTNADYNTD